MFFVSLHCDAFHEISSISTAREQTKFSKKHQNKPILIPAATIQKRPLMAGVRYIAKPILYEIYKMGQIDCLLADSKFSVESLEFSRILVLNA